MSGRRYLTPFPDVPAIGDSELDVSAKIETPTGWLDLQDTGNGYSFEATSFSERAGTFRRQEVAGPFVDGTFVVSAVRENITESVAIYVRGDTHYVMRRRLNALVEAFSQLSYRMLVRFEDAAEYWDCLPADYTVSTQREFLHARLALFKANVPRMPATTTVLASEDER